MPKPTFISFRGEDPFKVNKLRGLAQFKNVDFVWDDVSLRNEINSTDRSYIRSVIKPKIASFQICLCLIGENTHRSRFWVPCEIELAIESRKEILAMQFWDSPNATTPKVFADNNIRRFNWDVDKLFETLDQRLTLTSSSDTLRSAQGKPPFR